MSGDNGKVVPKKTDKKKSKGWISRMIHKHNSSPDPLTRFLRAYNASLSFAVLCLAAVLHVTGTRTIELSYRVEQEDGSVLYGFGPADLYFFFVSVFFLTFARAAFLTVVSNPLATAMKIKEKDRVKYNDMAWQGTYYATAWISGFIIMCRRSDTWGWQIDKMTESFPDKFIEGDMKLYYMLQGSFWIHAIIIHTVEMWRKDFMLYYIHHFITSSLVVGSYFKGATRIGFFILVEQDFADIFLPIAKCLNYANWEPASTIVFALFAVAWIPTRHWIYNLYLIEIWNMDRSSQEAMETLSTPEYWGFFIFLATLQVLLIIWLKDLLTAIWKVLQPNFKKLDDHRSSGEES